MDPMSHAGERVASFRGHGWSIAGASRSISPISWLADANLSLRAPKVATVAGRTPSSRFDSANALVSTTPSAAFSPCGPLPRHSASQLRGALATKIGEKSGWISPNAQGCDSGMEMGLEFENVEIGLAAGGVAALTGEAVSARSGLESVYAWYASRSRGHGRTLRRARSDD